jgi:hypothetical protein
LRAVGLGYVTLGQPTWTLSGGEAQRLKLASFIDEGESGTSRLLLFDEPTTGLHLSDVARLIDVLRGIVARGATVLVVEHNVDFIAAADLVGIWPTVAIGVGRCRGRDSLELAQWRHGHCRCARHPAHRERPLRRADCLTTAVDPPCSRGCVWRRRARLSSPLRSPESGGKSIFLRAVPLQSLRRQRPSPLGRRLRERSKP